MFSSLCVTLKFVFFCSLGNTHFRQETVAFCAAHQQFCRVNPGKGSLQLALHGLTRKALVVNNAGNCCQGWSAEGARAKKAHSSMHALAVWVCQRKEMARQGEEDLFFQECTPLFDLEGCLITPLFDSHTVVSVITGPSALGWPACRDRQLSAGLSLQTLVWVGPQDPKAIQEDFDALFSRSCLLNGNVFFRADDLETATYYTQKLQKRGFYGSLPGPGQGMKLLRRLLTPGQVQRLQQYQGLQKDFGDLDGTYICDLDHWPNSPGPQAGPYFPTLLRHGTIIDINSCKLAMTSDRFLSLGFHVGDVSDRFQWPLAAFVLEQSERVLKSLSGNCQSIPSILAWNLYVLSNTVRREIPNPNNMDLTLNFFESESEGNDLEDGA